ncbi:MAG: enoyl-CoA hydratase-related protein [Flavobacteriales bacterium]|nr:enoyl-CoA hydratase-related protein [Flavobacteriales bacterium]
MSYKNLLWAVQDETVIVTINRPDKLNALNTETLAEIKDAISKFKADKTLRGAIITGSGEKAFVAGADISEFSEFKEQQGYELSKNGHDIFNLIESSPKPILAAINGFALGGGCELAMSCHLRTAAPNAKFGQPEVNLGLIPGYGGTQRLIQLIGKGRATEYLLTGDMIKAEQALNWGLVTHVFDNELISNSIEILKKIYAKSPIAIGKTIDCINAYFNPDEDGLKFEIKAFSECCGTVDFIEGTSAFLEKRKPNFPVS